MLHELERMMREGQLPDPRTLAGLLVYAAVGLAVGFWLA